MRKIAFLWLTSLVAGCGLIPSQEFEPVPAAAAGSGGASTLGQSGGASTLARAGTASVIVVSPATPAATTSAALPPLLAEPVRRASRAVPISGGTLLVTADGTTAVAADPDRDLVFIVDLSTRAVRTLALAPQDEPGRVVEGAGNTIYVAARSGGAVLAIDRALGTVTQRLPVCNAPRGLWFDAPSNRIYVACRSGRLVALDAASGNVAASFDLDDDLRDVVVQDGRIVVSRFRSAELVVLEPTGAVLQRVTPLPTDTARPQVGFRFIPHPSGSVLMAHQLHSDSPIPTGVGSYYGAAPCQSFAAAVVQQAVTTFAAAGSSQSLPSDSAAPAPFSKAATITAGTLRFNAAGPVDLAVSRDGKRLALVASGNSWLMPKELPTLFVSPLSDPLALPAAAFDPCVGQNVIARHMPGEAVAVAFDAAGRYIVQSREPAMLELEGDTFIALSNDSRFDTGLALFHVNTGGGVSCASCHPEGGDDAHVWNFAGLGLRRSQSLEGGVTAQAPFHWEGDLPSFDALFEEVMMRRMALPVVPPPAARAALAGWLDTVPRPKPSDLADATAVERGRALFAAVGCTSCHSGESYTDNLLHDVGTSGSFITPSLLGVGHRTPIMHDGCARTLRDRFGTCGGSTHGDVSRLSATQLDDVTAFMKSL